MNRITLAFFLCVIALIAGAALVSYDAESLPGWLLLITGLLTTAFILLVMFVGYNSRGGKD